MSVQAEIQKLIEEKFSPSYLEVINESYKHNVPEGSESHFKVICVSESFQNQSLVQRHQSLNKVLLPYMNQPIHALSMVLHTTQEWQDKGEASPKSPPCLGGSKRESL